MDHHYYTYVVYNYWRRRFQCFPVKLPNDDFLMSVDAAMTHLDSPGFPTGKTYPPERLSYYHVNCSKNVTFHVQMFHLQDRINVYPKGKLCVDYILVDGSSTDEHCGNQTPMLDTYSGNVLITFRSSRYDNYKGFRITAICMDLSEQEQPGCLKMNDKTLGLEDYAEPGKYANGEMMVRIEKHFYLIRDER